jgi:hypothetical protein
MSNGHDFRQPSAEAEATARHKDQLLALTIGHEIIDLVKAKHPQVHPATVANALASTMASMIVMFAKGDAEALGGAEAAYRTLRTNVIGMMAAKRRKEAEQ